MTARSNYKVSCK